VLSPEKIGESVWNTYRSMASLIEGDWVGEGDPKRTTRLMDAPGGLASGGPPEGGTSKARRRGARVMSPRQPGNLSAGKDPRKKNTGKDTPPK
jgi:hypothetical protein